MKSKTTYPRKKTRAAPPVNEPAPETPVGSMVVREAGPLYGYMPEEAMVRTQVYLTRGEHDFLMSEGNRRNLPMAAIIREYIDEKMDVPEDAWSKNPLLEPPAQDPDYIPREDGVINHDHYIYGGPKKFEKRGGKWRPVPPEE